MDSLAGLRVAAYARFSSDNQRDTSIDDQVNLAREFIQRHGGKVTDGLVFTDYAVSGVSRAREGFERLLRLIEERKVNVVVTESASRLSRDLGDADRLWKLCEFQGVRLICISEGVDSARDGARMAFQMNAILSDQYLVKLGKETLRGLRGAADRGHSTGGLPYGYTSRPIWNGGREPDGFDILVAPEQAAVVVRIFEMYRDGYSYLTIATRLNDERVPPPRFESRKHPTKFWKKGTVREMLRNAAYTGRWSFGRRHWRRDPTTRKRRYVKRPAHEVKVSDRPHLRIIEDELWEAVRQRRDDVRANYAGKRSGAPGHRTHRPLSGLLFCGLCGHRMVDAGGSSSRYYRCSANGSGGACGNDQKVREDVLVDAAVRELKRLLFDTELHEQLRNKIEKRIAAYRSRSSAEQRAAEKELRQLEAETSRLVGFIRRTDETTNPGAFEAVRVDLENVTSRQVELKAKLTALATRSSEPRLPTVDEIMTYVMDVEARIKDDPTTAREALRQVLVNGKIVVTPEGDGACRAESMLIVGRLTWKTRKPRSGGPSGASGSHVVEIGSCAGRI